MDLQMNNYAGGAYGQVISYVYRIVNCTKHPLWLSDGSSSVQFLPPMTAPDGSFPSTLPRDYYGHVVIIACELSQDVTTNATTWNHKWSKVIGTPPEPGYRGTRQDALQNWMVEIKDFNMVLFGDEAKCRNFVMTWKNYYSYVMNSDYGTRFANSANYGILNCTGKTLFQVDDTAIEDCQQSDIIEIPAGGDAPLPLWDNQQFNNKENVRSNVPYVRAYRYTMVATGNGEYVGFMREHIYNWTPDVLGQNGFLFIPYHHMCLFDDRQTAEQFVRMYKTVERYHMSRIAKDMEDKLQKKFDEQYQKQKKQHKRVMIGCAIVLSLQIASKIGEIVSDEMKKRKKEKLNAA